jgi:hypothetical protein
LPHFQVEARQQSKLDKNGIYGAFCSRMNQADMLVYAHSAAKKAMYEKPKAYTEQSVYRGTPPRSNRQANWKACMERKNNLGNMCKPDRL